MVFDIRIMSYVGVLQEPTIVADNGQTHRAAVYCHLLGEGVVVTYLHKAKDVEVVIEAVESNQARDKTANELEGALAIKTEEPAAALLEFWRNSNVLVLTWPLEVGPR